MPEQNNYIGGLWVNKSKSGSTYMKGSVKVGGEEVRVVIFKNSQKKSSKHPDWTVMLDTPKVIRNKDTDIQEDNEGYKNEGYKEDFDDGDIPF